MFVSTRDTRYNNKEKEIATIVVTKEIMRVKYRREVTVKREQNDNEISAGKLAGDFV